MLDFRRLLYFCTIIEQGQISRAAKALHISQPTLSLSLKELEDELGVTLIHRNGGNWQVTERGRSLYLEAQRILTQLDDLSQNIMNPSAGNSGIFGEVRIGCSGFCFSFLRSILPRLEKEYPGVHIRVQAADNIALETKLQRQNVDIALLQLPLLYGNCHTLPLREQHLVAVWSPLLKAPPEATVSLETLSRWPLLVARRWSNRGALRPFIVAMQEKGLTPRILLDSPSTSFLMEALESLPAVAVIHQTEVTSLYARTFPVRRIDLPSLVFRPAVIWRKDRALSPAGDRLVDLICEQEGLHRPD